MKTAQMSISREILTDENYVNIDLCATAALGRERQMNHLLTHDWVYFLQEARKLWRLYEILWRNTKT
jgi:hypothetical protein